MPKTVTTVHLDIYEKNTNKVILYQTSINNETRSIYVIPLSEITSMKLEHQKLLIGFKSSTLSFIDTQEGLDTLYNTIQKCMLCEKED